MAVRLGFGRWGRVPFAIGIAVVMQTGYGTVPATGQSDSHVVSIDDVWAYEADGSIFFRLTRTRATGRPISISYQTVDGDAIGGKDYETAQGTVIFGPKEDSAFVIVSILDDGEDESDEIFELALLSPPGGVTITRPRSRATIWDDDRLELPVKP